MIKYLLICLLAICHGINGRPSQQLSGDLASHILIVTPQAQVQLEPALKYDGLSQATFIQHLSPLARISAPHEETIIYVPSGAALDHGSISLARSAVTIAEPFRKQETKQYEAITQQIEQAQAAINQGTSAVGPQLSEAASAAASAASSAGSGFFPALFPPAAPAAPSASAQKIDYQALPSSPLLVTPVAEGRRFYAVAPSLSHVIDFVHSPVFVGPFSAVRARSVLPEEVEKQKLIEETILPAVESFKSELAAGEILLQKKETEVTPDLPKIESDRILIDPIKEEITSIKIEKMKLEEKLPLEKLPLEKQLKKVEPVKKEFINKEKEAIEVLERKEEVKDYKVPESKLPQERKEELKEFNKPVAKAEEIKAFKVEEQKPLESKEKYIEKAEQKDVKELKEIREELKTEDKEAKAPQQQQQQFLKEGFKPESIKAVEEQNLNKISAIPAEKQDDSQINTQQQQTLRSSSGRIEASEVVPVHAHVHHDKLGQQQKSVVVPVDQPVEPVFVPQLKAL